LFGKLFGVSQHLLTESDCVHLLLVAILHFSLKLGSVLLDVRIVRLEGLVELGQVSQFAALLVVFNDTRNHAHCAVDLRVF
jgi:hypothetical protein